MVMHIVFWRLTDEALPRAEALAQDLQARFFALLGVIDGLKEISFGKNYNGGEFNMALTCVFTDHAALEAYQNHPAHLAVAKDVRAATHGRQCVDYEF